MFDVECFHLRSAVRPPFPGHTGLDGGGGDGGGDTLHHVAIENAGHNVFRAQFPARNAARNGVRGGQLHRLVDASGAHVQGTPENSRKRQHVVDLVGIVAPARRHNPRPRGGFLRHDFRDGVGQRKDNRLRCHVPERLRRNQSRPGDADQNIRFLQGDLDAAAQAAWIGGGRELRFRGIQIGPRAAIDDALPVANDDVFHPGVLQHHGDGRARRARAENHNPQSGERAARQARGVQQRRQHDHRRAVLVVVKDGNVQSFLQPPLDFKAARRGDVFEVDAAQTHREIGNGVDDFLGVLRAQANRVGVNAGKFLEQHRLAFHDGHRGFRADVAEAQHRRAVADYGDGIALDGQLPGFVVLLGDGGTHARHAGRVSHREGVPRRQRHLVLDGNFSAEMQEKNLVRNVGHDDILQFADGRHDGFHVFLAARPHRDVARHALGVGIHNVHRAEVAAQPADGVGELGEHANVVGIGQPHDKAVADGRTCFGGVHKVFLVSGTYQTRLASIRECAPEIGPRQLFAQRNTVLIWSAVTCRRSPKTKARNLSAARECLSV